MSTRKMTKSAGVVGVAIAISRVMGLIRDQVFAYFFGATPIADAFILAFRIPNLLRDLFAEGALSQAYVPTFTKVLMQKGEKAAWRLTNLVLNWQIAILSAITVIGMIFAPQLVTLLANTGRHAGSSFSDPQILNLAILLTQIMFPFIILVAMAAVFMGTLNVKHIFFIPASASTMFNITSVVFGCIFGYWIYRDAPRAAVVGWAVGTLAGGFTQAAVQVPSLWRLGWRYEFRFAGPDSGLSDVIKRVIPGIIAVSPVQVNVLVSTWFAASLEAGSVAWLSYAFRLIFLPIGLFGVGIATVALPSISESASEKNLTEFRQRFNHSLRLAMSLAIPSAVGMAIIAPLLISVLYERGQFRATDTIETARILQIYSIGLIGYTALKVIVPAFYALGHPRQPMYVSLAFMGVNIFLSWYFVRVLDLHARGLALATAVSALLNSGILIWMLRSLLEKRIDFHRTTLGLIRVAVASGVMAAAVYWLWQLLISFNFPQTLFFNLIALMLLVLDGAVIFLAAARFLRVQEVREITDLILEKLKV